jgi:hypothetical protein
MEITVTETGDAFVRACTSAAARRSGRISRVEVGPVLAGELKLGETLEIDGKAVPVTVRERQHADVAAVVVTDTFHDRETLAVEAFYFAIGAGSEAQTLYHVLRRDGVSSDEALAAVEAVG